MRVIRFADSRFVEGTAAQPQPGRGELLIRVCAAGMIQTEVGWYPTSHTKADDTRIGAVPGHEFSGVVAGVGEGIDSNQIGREVFGMNDWFSAGAMAEYCLALPSAVAPKPPGVTHVQAASVPISALTAWQGLFERAHLRSGERVLVHGGAGAVGTFAVQLANLHGAHVTATASARNVEFVRSLGAEQVLDRQVDRFEKHVQDIDVVFDTVGGETLERSWSVLKPSGRMITVTSGVENSTNDRVKQAFFIVEPNQKQLVEIGRLLEAGQLQAIVDTVITLSRVPEAYAGQVPRQNRGKLVVSIADV